ncbi:hypothetical protein [Ewingella americana]|uniref:hypothetical protein n=1 Tax=Ewingella americana TaxID=41202 RepID=UPI0012AD277A|nr:hypothetical protein [Ewingella americana]MRT05956.1 hypothetical protein [Ewingella americana]
MGKVVKFVKPKASKNSDPWCSPIIRKDGSMVSGGAAREMRIKAVGGVDQLLRTTLANATLLASKNVG